jgi:hypothetical protein
LANGTAYRKQLPIVHAPDNVSNDGAHDLLYPGQAKCGGLLHNEVRLRCLQRLKKVLIHPVICELEDQLGKVRGVGSWLLSVLNRLEYLQCSYSQFLRMVEAKKRP